MNEVIRVDLHTHTWFSPDSLTRPGTLVRAARQAGLHRIAVTDHDQIDGALEAQALDPELVIVGEEIRCACKTEVIGLFLKRWIPPKLSVPETIAAIREQGGVAFAPHPFAYWTRGAERAQLVLPLVDVAEVFNSRAFYPAWNRNAAQRCAELARAGAACTDAHFPWELGRAYTEMPAFTDATSFLSALPQARPVAVRNGNPFLHVASITLHKTRRLLGLANGAPVGARIRRPPVLVE
jgi:predicted metal-dependent phosphoesterase TrpH